MARKEQNTRCKRCNAELPDRYKGAKREFCKNETCRKEYHMFGAKKD